MRKVTAIAAALLSIGIMLTNTRLTIADGITRIADEPINEVTVAEEPMPVISNAPMAEPVVEEELLSDDDIALIALVTMAEAEGECEEGKRLVIDTVLNRMDSEYFPDTAYDVIYQPSQFSSMWNGRIDCCEVRDDICQLVIEEARNRLNKDVIFFTAGHYSKYGVPMFQVEHHYFSSYD